MYVCTHTHTHTHIQTEVPVSAVGVFVDSQKKITGAAEAVTSSRQRRRRVGATHEERIRNTLGTHHYKFEAAASASSWIGLAAGPALLPHEQPVNSVSEKHISNTLATPVAQRTASQTLHSGHACQIEHINKRRRSA